MPVAGSGSSTAKARADQIAGGVILALGLYVAWEARAYPFGSLAEPGPGMMPSVLGLVFAGFGLVLVLSGRVRAEAGSVRFGELPQVLIILSALSAAALLIERIGWRALVIVLLLFFLIVIERRNPWVSIALAALVSFGSFYLINTVLRVPLPLGPWGY